MRMPRAGRFPALLLALGAAGCAAGAGESGYYGAVRGGAWSPAESGKAAQLRAGGEIALGRIWRPWLRTEVGLGLAGTRASFAGLDAQATPTRVDANVITLTGSARAGPRLGPVEIWGLVGAGGFRVEPRSAGAPVLPSDARPRTQLGAQLGAGLLVPLGADFEATLGGRGFRSFPPVTGASSRVQGAGVLAGIGFRF
jgi:hypothetical protein